MIMDQSKVASVSTSNIAHSNNRNYYNITISLCLHVNACMHLI